MRVLSCHLSGNHGRAEHTLLLDPDNERGYLFINRWYQQEDSLGAPFGNTGAGEAVFEALGGFCAHARSAFDWEMWIRIAAVHPVAFVP